MLREFGVSCHGLTFCSRRTHSRQNQQSKSMWERERGREDGKQNWFAIGLLNRQLSTKREERLLSAGGCLYHSHFHPHGKKNPPPPSQITSASYRLFMSPFLACNLYFVLHRAGWAARAARLAAAGDGDTALGTIVAVHCCKCRIERNLVLICRIGFWISGFWYFQRVLANVKLEEV